MTYTDIVANLWSALWTFHAVPADPQKRAAALVLEVKGDFCHDIRAVFEDAGRGDDYTELALGGRWQWNPLATEMDSYSLAYTVASLLNQLFGKNKEPFWQQAYTNLIRWLIERHRALPDQWVTFRDLYHCAIDRGALIPSGTLKCTRAADRTGGSRSWSGSCGSGRCRTGSGRVFGIGLRSVRMPCGRW